MTGDVPTKIEEEEFDDVSCFRNLSDTFLKETIGMKDGHISSFRQNWPKEVKIQNDCFLPTCEMHFQVLVKTFCIYKTLPHQIIFLFL